MKIITRFIAACGVILLFFGVAFLNFLSWEIAAIVPHLPVWIIPLISLILSIIVGYKYFHLQLKSDEREREFLTIASHTFRTPLTRVKWLGNELTHDTPRETRSLYIQNMNNAVDRVLDIVDLLIGVRNINDRSGYNFIAVSLREIVEGSISRYRETIAKKNISLQIPVFDNFPFLTVDTKKISFVINVLIENAVSYTPDNGKIGIEAVVKDNKILLSVSDTGIGLSPKDKRNLFNRFYRGERAKKMNTDGMGLGLYLSEAIIKRHKGTLTAQSDGHEKGSSFIVTLPRK